MHKAFAFLIAVTIAVGCSVTLAMAHWEEADGHKMHTPQLPDPSGWDVNATNPIVLADDWQCSETGLIKDVHFWGSWLGGVDGVITSFHLSIHKNVEGPPSKPGTIVWEQEVFEFTQREIYSPYMQGWYDPSTGLLVPDDHNHYFQYNILIEDIPQEQDSIYWLDVSATVEDPVNTHWGWKSSVIHWQDDAVWGELGLPGWTPLYEPPEFSQTLDLAFVITGEGLPPVPPDVWITPNPPWDNPDIWLSAPPVEGTSVTIFARIHNTGGVDAIADITFEWGYIGTATAPAFWNPIGTTHGVVIPAGGTTITSYFPWHIPIEAVGHSCVRVSIGPTVPPESDLTPVNDPWENLDVLMAIAGEEAELTVPILNPEDVPSDIYIEFHEVYLPEGWDAWISTDYFELVGPGEMRDLTVYFSVPQTAVPGDSALANFEVYLAGGEHIGGKDIRVIVVSEEEIPTLTEWGLIIFGAVLLGFITWVFLRRRRVAVVRVR